MLAVTRGRTLQLFRNVNGHLERWRTLYGTPAELARGLASAQELDQMASALGGWRHALCLGLYPAKPVHPAKVGSGVFLQNKLNGSLGKL